jgi:hypothetical protein
MEPYIINLSKSRRERWVGHEARMMRSAYAILVGKPEGKNTRGRPGRIILKLIFRR